MKLHTYVAALLVALVFSPAMAQYQTPEHSVPVGRGGGKTGFNKASPGVAGYSLVSNGPDADPSFQNVPGVPHVASMAALRTAPTSGLVAGQTISVGGYSTENDGGGGLFTVSLANATDDSGCVINSSVGVVSYTRNACFNGQPMSVNYFGAKGDNSTSNTAAFNAAFAYAKSSGIANYLVPGASLCLYVPRGTYQFATQPNNIDFQLCLLGESTATTLIRNFSPTGANGLLNFVGGANSWRVENMGILAASGTTGGTLISVISTASASIGFCRLRNLQLSTKGTDTYNNALYFDGTAFVGPPIGIRDCTFENLAVFGANGNSVFLSGVENLTWNGGGVFAAGGTGTGTGRILINGSASVQSNAVNINVSTVLGGLSIFNTNNAIINSGQIGATGGVSITNGSSAAFISVHSPQFTGTVQGNWVSSTSGP